jgi:hypothetical protein
MRLDVPVIVEDTSSEESVIDKKLQSPKTGSMTHLSVKTPLVNS